MKLPSVINKLCLPAKVYLFLSIISIILYLVSMSNVNDTIIEAEPEGNGVNQYTFHGLIINIIFTIVWVFVLNYICGFKYGKKIAWFIVLLPFFFMGLMLIGLMCAVSFISLQTQKTKSLQNELNNFKNQLPLEESKKERKDGYVSELLR
tara:strand:+ start:233 stop:682 length:450 start_codon:yes stop_codon:yes gene_type:complete